MIPFEDGLVKRKDVYSDSVSILRQLGLIRVGANLVGREASDSSVKGEPMKRKGILVVAGVGTLAALIAATVGGTAFAGAVSGNQGAQTQITIAPYEKGLIGTLSSPAERCAKDRNVKVFRQKGEQQKPKTDKVIDKTSTLERRGLSQWSVKKGTSGGQFYAKAAEAQRLPAGVQ